MKTEQGSLTAEMVLLTPVLVILVLFGVHVGRLSEAKIQVQHAADQGARMGSKVAYSQIDQAARGAIIDDLSQSGVSCVDLQVDIEVITMRSFDAIEVNVECQVRTDGTELLALYPDKVHASSVEVIDRWSVR